MQHSHWRMWHSVMRYVWRSPCHAFCQHSYHWLPQGLSCAQAPTCTGHHHLGLAQLLLTRMISGALCDSSPVTGAGWVSLGAATPSICADQPAVGLEVCRWHSKHLYTACQSGQGGGRRCYCQGVSVSHGVPKCLFTHVFCMTVRSAQLHAEQQHGQ